MWSDRGGVGAEHAVSSCGLRRRKGPQSTLPEPFILPAASSFGRLSHAYTSCTKLMSPTGESAAGKTTILFLSFTCSLMSACEKALHSHPAGATPRRDVKPDNILWRYNEQGELDIRLSDLAFADFDSGYNLSSECGECDVQAGGAGRSLAACICLARLLPALVVESAKQMSNDRHSFSFSGTPEYQAPETQIENPRVCRRGGTYTRACDVWSLGKRCSRCVNAAQSP